MLERQRFLIVRDAGRSLAPFRPFFGARAETGESVLEQFGIYDFDTLELLGHARLRARWGRWLRSLLGPSFSIEVRETDDEPLLFTSRSRKVYDAEDVLVGFFRAPFSFRSRPVHIKNHTVHDRKGAKLAEVKGDWSSQKLQFFAADGKDLGQCGQTSKSPDASDVPVVYNYFVLVSDDLADQPLAKMLLLADALWNNLAVALWETSYLTLS